MSTPTHHLHPHTIYTQTPSPSKPNTDHFSIELKQMVAFLVHSLAHSHLKAMCYDQYASLNARTTVNRVGCPVFE